MRELLFEAGVETAYGLKSIVSSALQVSSSKAAGSAQANSAGGAVAGATGTGSAAPAQGDLDLFSETSGSSKAEDSAKKPLSKDSILSLYGSSTVPQQPAQGTSIPQSPTFLFLRKWVILTRECRSINGAMHPESISNGALGVCVCLSERESKRGSWEALL